ncbi:MAG: DNA polymerase III subunit delta [Planctomycetes bacterium]|nr:DNA polymerase III subunit delta [Planctomycetota bacterium]
MPSAIPALSFIKNPASLPDAPIYAVYGGEDYLRRRALAALIEILRTKRKLEIKRVRELEAASALLDDLRSPSMFGGGFAIVLANAREGNRQEPSTRFKEEFAAYIEKPSKRHVLVFEGVTWQRNLTVPKRVEEHFPTIVAEELKPWDARGWNELAAMQAREIGVELDPAAMAALRDTVGGNLATAQRELEKLALIAQDGRIRAEDIARSCGYEGVDVTFPLCDAILSGDSNAALQYAAKLAGKAEIGSVLSFLALVRLQVVALGRASLAMKAGDDAGQAAMKAAPRLRDNLRPGLIRTAKAIGRDDVARAVEVLIKADEDMKSSAPDPGALLVGVVARLCDILRQGEPGALARR